jgi:chromosomal replication initiation ATPase DnaA
LEIFRRDCGGERDSFLLSRKKWLIKLWLKELPQQVIEELEKELSKELQVFAGLSIKEDSQTTTELLLLDKQGKSVGIITIKRECSLSRESYFPVYAILNAREEGRRIAELLKEKLKSYLLPELSVNLSFYNPWGSNPEYSLSPQEFAKGIEPKLFYGIDVDALAESYFRSARTLLILYGAPGTGKSKLIQYLISRAPRVYRKSVEVLVLKGKGLSEAAADLHTFLAYDIVVLDDLEVKSFKRGEDEDITALISTLLSATDGFIPKKAKVIITTNRPFREIEPALLRPSRLFDIIELKEIDRKAFEELCTELPYLRKAEFLFRENPSVPVARLVEESVKEEERDYLKVKELSKKRESYQRSLGF